MTQPVADYFPIGISQYVPNCQYAIDADIDNILHTVDFGAPVALDTDGVLDGVTMVNGSAVTVTDITTTAGGAGTATGIGYYGFIPFDTLTPTRQMRGYGRNLTFVASSTNTRVVTITGYDYLGQKMVEAVTLNSGTPVSSVKAFYRVVSISFASASDTTTVDVGWGNKFGLPLAGDAMVSEMKNNAASANAGTFTAGLADATASTSTTVDPRGLYAPATVLPDGTNTFKIIYVKRRDNLHGNAQYAT